MKADRVAQRTDTDCAVCCLAMLTGRAYEEVIATIGDLYDPALGIRYDDRALKLLGFDGHFENGQPAGDYLKTHCDWAWSAPFYRRMAWGRRALVTVPSLNFPAPNMHMVYFDGRAVHDPSTKLRYERFDQLEPVEMVLFREGD